ncbi:MAG TPA: hypothetical protein PKE32_02450 [Miltoncostaeaceae bacterium]|nr:hypothetical protein [Miltoncostaeaceae bacterium]
MPSLSRWCIRAALAYLVVGMALGSWMLILQATRGYALASPWPALHAHLLLVGFLLLAVFGVAFWMFPKDRGARSRQAAGWVGFWLINLGLLGRLLAEPLADNSRGPLGWRVIVGIAAVPPPLGARAFGIALWPRVRAAMTKAEAEKMRASRTQPAAARAAEQRRNPPGT